MRKICKITLIMAVMTFVFCFSASAKSYTKQGTYVWKQIDGLFYAYDAETGQLIRNAKVGKCYVDANGTRYLNCFVNGTYYNYKGFRRVKFKGGWIKTGGKYYYFRDQKRVTGYRKINGKRYYFDSEGARQHGLFNIKGKYRYFKKNGVMIKSRWKTINGKRYFFSKKGYIKQGFIKVNKKKYYQTIETGIVTGQQTINGKVYYFSSKGVYNAAMTRKLRGTSVKLGNYSDILFFTKFESGDSGYAQTGGDSGNACGKYQFDYRYSLQPFIKYCYSANKEFFKDFKPFVSCSKSSLKGNSKLYKAWKACYKADSKYFSNMQDEFALDQYYKPCEKALSARGIHMELRSYVCRGAVFSYSIQHGQTTAVNAVVNAGLKDSVDDRDFLKKLYNYRWRDSKGWAGRSVFSYRYNQEKALALSTYDKIS